MSRLKKLAEKFFNFSKIKIERKTKNQDCVLIKFRKIHRNATFFENLKKNERNHKIIIYDFFINTDINKDVKFIIDFKIFLENLLELNIDNALKRINKNDRDIFMFYDIKNEKIYSFSDRTIDIDTELGFIAKKILTFITPEKSDLCNIINNWIINNGGIIEEL